MDAERPVVKASDLEPGHVVRAGGWAVANADGRYVALSRRCRHWGADLSRGSIARDGCLVCPWHGARYDVDTGRMVRGPRGMFEKIPGLNRALRTLTRVVPLRRRRVVEREGDLFLEG